MTRAVGCLGTAILILSGLTVFLRRGKGEEKGVKSTILRRHQVEVRNNVVCKVWSDGGVVYRGGRDE